jgi:tetratricopeptide (TPR) repeat protein
MAVALVTLCLAPAFAQVGTGTVRGIAKDKDGKPLAGITLLWVSSETGRKYEIKTNAKGEYFSLGIGAGQYTVTLMQNGQELFHYNGVHVTLEDNTYDFDMQKEQGKAAAGAGLTPEQLKAHQEQVEKVQKENLTVKALNEKLSTAKQAADTGNYDAAIATLTEATQMDATRDLLWAKLGEYEATSAGKQTDSAEKAKRYDAAISDYQKAVDIKQKVLDAAPAPKPPDATKILAQYYNNMGQAAGKDNKTDDAVKAYTQAAQLDPAGAGQYYFNLGAIMTNVGRVDDAISAFDKAIAADPNRADAYYWKGVNLIGKATLKGDKMVAPDGTAEAFSKYLELQPTGQFADPAKQMLASIGASVETKYGKPKPPKK